MTGAAQVMALIVSAAQSAGVNPQLALALAQQESGYNQSKIGAAGEVGVFQLLPSTAADLGVNPYDLNQNIRGGIVYLKKQLDRFNGNVAMALAAYNAGPSRVEQAVASGANWISKIPASTQAYIGKIAGNAAGIKPAPSTDEIMVPGTNYAVIAQPQPAPTSSWWPLWLLGGAGLLYLIA
jgi:soluble lytic murein transglycosylase-like protein